MIELRNGDILQADVEALVNTVNCVGVMGRGIALQFKKAFPKMFAQYKQACDSGAVRPGEVLTCDLNRVVLPRYVINFPTKRHWRGTSRLADIDAGLAALVAEVRRLGLRSLAVPPLGCGLGGLRWSDVRPRIEQAFDREVDHRPIVDGQEMLVCHQRQRLQTRAKAASKDNALHSAYPPLGSAPPPPVTFPQLTKVYQSVARHA